MNKKNLKLVASIPDFVLYWNAELELNLMDVEWVDVILTHTRQLAEQIPEIDPDIKIEERFLDSIADWLAKEIVQKVERKEMEAELESKFKIGVEIPFFLKAFLGLKAYIRDETEEVKEMYLFSSFQTKLIDEQFFEFVVDIFSL